MSVSKQDETAQTNNTLVMANDERYKHVFRRGCSSSCGNRCLSSIIPINKSYRRCCLLLVACCLLFVACCLLFVACCLLLVACCLLLVALLLFPFLSFFLSFSPSFSFFLLSVGFMLIEECRSSLRCCCCGFGSKRCER